MDRAGTESAVVTERSMQMESATFRPNDAICELQKYGLKIGFIGGRGTQIQELSRTCKGQKADNPTSPSRTIARERG